MDAHLAVSYAETARARIPDTPSCSTAVPAVIAGPANLQYQTACVPAQVPRQEYPSAAFAVVDKVTGVVVDGGLLPEPSDDVPEDFGSVAEDANSTHVVVGSGDLYTAPGTWGTVPVRRSLGETVTMEYLPQLDALREGRAYGINEEGFAVGYCKTRDIGNQAVMWSTDGSEVVNLNTLLSETDRSVWILRKAADINNEGQIVGKGRLNGVVRGFVLDLNTPTPSIAAVPLPFEASQNTAWKINDAGIVIGDAYGETLEVLIGDFVSVGANSAEYLPSSTGGLAYTPTPSVAAVPLPFGASQNVAWKINDAGIVIGEAYGETLEKFVGGFVSVGANSVEHLPSSTGGWGLANGLNNFGELCGRCRAADDVYDMDYYIGEMTLWKLNAELQYEAAAVINLVPSKPYDYIPVGGDINDDGWAVGRGRKFEKGKYTYQGILVVPRQ